jgi:hypothetical protein
MSSMNGVWWFKNKNKTDSTEKGGWTLEIHTAFNWSFCLDSQNEMAAFDEQGPDGGPKSTKSLLSFCL